MTSRERQARNRKLIPLLVAVLGITLGAAGFALLRPLRSGGTQRLTATADKRPVAAGRLSDAAIRSRIEPSVVDVTATLTYDGETASGTGFVVDSRSGLVLTNNHVIRDATSVSVTVPATGHAYRASIVGVDVTADVAVLSIGPNPGLPVAPLGDSTTVAGGAPVISFGNQAGAGGTPAVAPGVITGTGRTIQADDGAAGFSETLHGMLATTARIEPGDSGGPLANVAGAVIGVDTATGTGGAPTGYAIPINVAMTAERQIVAHHGGQGISLGANGFLGVIMGSGPVRSPAAQQTQEQGITTGSVISPAPAGCVPTRGDATAPALIAPALTGALVVGVLCGTGAATAGITPGDVITAADGRPVDSPDALTAIVSAFPPGGLLRVTWMSASGVTSTAPVRLSTAPAA